MNRILRWLYEWYGLNSQEVAKCDAVVALGYGLLRGSDGIRLPDAEKKVLQEAVVIAHKFRAPIIWANAGYLYPGSAEEENNLKIRRVGELMFGGEFRTVPGGVTNTVTEAQGIKNVLGDSGGKTIVVIADWGHSRSARLVWQMIFPNSQIVMRVVVGEWDEDHFILFCRSPFYWLGINIFRHLVLKMFGLGFASKLQHPVKKR